MSGYVEIQQARSLLDISVLRLNKLSGRYGIKPSFGGGKKKGSRRHFSLGDVCHLGIVAWLSNAGLRAPAIKDVLRRTAVKSLLASLDTLKNVETEANRGRFLVAVGFRGVKSGYRNVFLVRSLKRVQPEFRNDCVVCVPVGRLFGDLAVRMGKFASS